MTEISATLPTKDRIIKATLDIIGSEGFQNVTVRKIATRAEVNIAAVNYHFGSKDVVIDKALKYVTSRIISVFSILENAVLSPEIRLCSFIKAYADTVYEYPDIIKYMINQKIHNADGRVEFSQYLENQGIGLVSQTLSELKPHTDSRMLVMKTLQILSCISFPILMGGQIREIAGLDLFNPETRTPFINLLIDSILDLPSPGRKVESADNPI